MRFGRLTWFLAGCLALSATARGQAAAVATKPPATTPATTASNGEKPLSTRIVAYAIDAKLDPKKHTIDATETLEYLNLTGQPQQTFPFHLYLNAFQPQSTFMTEVHRSGTRGNGPGSAWDPLHKGAIDVSHLEADGVDLTDKMQFVHPDDDNAQDKTVFQVTLPKPVAPGATVKFSFTFHDLLPEVVERTGYMHDFDMVGQWFPKVGVWWKNEWNCHQFHASTEFFADFGTFDVKITLPKNEVVGAGGDLVDRHDNPDGSMTLHYWSQDVHDFSWAASPSFTRVEDSWTGSGQPVKIVVLISPGNMPSAPRYVQALKGSLTMFDKWYGPYPYDRITLIDPPHGGSDAGGMEYPTLITGDTTWNMPKNLLLPEIVTEHEFGHQYWYGMVATNEFEEAWLDEGINSYTEVKVMDALYGKNSFMNFPFAQLSEDGAERAMYLSNPDSDPISRLGWKFYSNNSYGAITYGKTATVLLTLEKVIGEDTLREALHTYFMRYRFTHPTGTDFIKTVEEVSGRDLKWYFDQAVYGTQVMDYSVANAHSDPLKWWEPSIGSNPKDEVYRTYVSVKRDGDFVFPVDVVVRFDDGSTATEHWDGQERWTRFQYDRKAKVVSAEIDPQTQVTMDRNFFNNSYTLDADARATHKMRNIFVFASEWVSQLLAWLT
ncbi:MAG: M1 family metallopeptidase [Candidatus Acidiferrales bacterium]